MSGDPDDALRRLLCAHAKVTALKRGIQDVDCSAFRFDPDQSPLGSRGDILTGDTMYIYGHKESDRGSGRSSGGEDLSIE
jgi:hypothetical protein